MAAAQLIGNSWGFCASSYITKQNWGGLNVEGSIWGKQNLDLRQSSAQLSSAPLSHLNVFGFPCGIYSVREAEKNQRHSCVTSCVPEPMGAGQRMFLVSSSCRRWVRTAAPQKGGQRNRKVNLNFWAGRTPSEGILGEKKLLQFHQGVPSLPPPLIWPGHSLPGPCTRTICSTLLSGTAASSPQTPTAGGRARPGPRTGRVCVGGAF